MAESLNECPRCLRKFEVWSDYPLLSIVDVSVVKLADIPQIVSTGEGNVPDLLEKPIKGWNREFVPKEVLEYFKTHSREKPLAHSDGFVYFTPETPGIMKCPGDNMPEFWLRQRNYVPEIRELLRENPPLRQYVGSLEKRVGREVKPSEILPPFRMDECSKHYIISPKIEALQLGLEEADAREDSRRLSVTLFSPFEGGDDYYEPIFSLGTITYEGRLASDLADIGTAFLLQNLGLSNQEFLRMVGQFDALKKDPRVKEVRLARKDQPRFWMVETVEPMSFSEQAGLFTDTGYENVHSLSAHGLTRTHNGFRVSNGSGEYLDIYIGKEESGR